jgi:SmpA / OmlA family
MRKWLLFFTTSLMLFGCMTIGNKFDISRVDQLQPGISTEADAKALFGEPTSVSTNPNNHHELLQWSYSQGAIVGGNGAHLAISFDENGKMIAVIQKTKV